MEFERRPEGRLGHLWQAAVVESHDEELLVDVLERGRDKDIARAWILHAAQESAAHCQTSDGKWLFDDRLSTRHRAVMLMEEVDALDRLGISEQLLSAASELLDIEDRSRLIRAIPSNADPAFRRHLDPDG